jgi:hypothetical protein
MTNLSIDIKMNDILILNLSKKRAISHLAQKNNG